jgi:ParB/RepB/Spo0J family partition protein
MTSGRFHSIPPSSIIINPDRQRKDLGNVEELAESIARLGLINPIVLDPSNVLIAGERRLTAIRSLGWTSIPVQYTTELSEYELQCIEFEENVKRKDLTWQEECAALEKFHALKSANEEGWTQSKTAESMGLSEMVVNRKLAVAKELNNERVAGADKFSAAFNLVSRSTERRKAAALENVGVKVAEVAAEAGIEPADTPVPAPLLCANFHEWQQAYDGPKFNLIHCDFPYGINVANSPRQNAALTDHYEDGADVYWDLLSRLGEAMHNVVADSAHLIFWFSMDYYADTVSSLSRMGWTVNPFPLIWHKSDNTGIAPDPQRWPRRTYETALVCSRGDRKLTQAGCRANSFAYPGSRDGAIHISEKPIPVLSHFMSMYCDEYSTVLDPTCGSGNALRAAHALGAGSVLGLELSAEFHAVSVANWRW